MGYVLCDAIRLLEVTTAKLNMHPSHSIFRRKKDLSAVLAFSVLSRSETIFLRIED